MAQNIDDLIEEYTTPGLRKMKEVVKITGQISIEENIRLEHLAAHFGTKKTPLFSKLVATAINEIFERVYDDMDTDIIDIYSQEIENYRRNEAYKNV